MINPNGDHNTPTSNPPLPVPVYHLRMFLRIERCPHSMAWSGDAARANPRPPSESAYTITSQPFLPQFFPSYYPFPIFGNFGNPAANGNMDFQCSYPPAYHFSDHRLPAPQNPSPRNFEDQAALRCARYPSLATAKTGIPEDPPYPAKDEPVTNPGSPAFSVPKVKKLISEYFYHFLSTDDKVDLSEEELKVLKVFLIKKLVHDKKKSRVFHQIVRLTEETLLPFMVANPPLNRKNIIKSNIFKKVWKLLEKRHGADFHDHYFAVLSPHFPPDSFSMRLYRRSHNFNLGDDFYTRCYLSADFREDFFAALADPAFKGSTLRISQLNFTKFFEGWLKDVQRFLGAGRNPFELSSKLPEMKFGVSSHDFELAASLFARIVNKPAIDRAAPLLSPSQISAIPALERFG